MARSFSLRRALKIGTIGLLSGVSGAVLASGFQNYDWSASSLGNAHAGSAARADDAATAWTNPAGLVLLNKKQAVGSGTLILGKFKYSHSSATTGAGTAFTNPGNLSDDPAVPAVLPALHYSHPYSKNLAFGMSATVPFGLATEYDKTSVHRYFATRSELITVDLNPSISYRVNDYLSLGAGASAQYMRAKLNKMADGAYTCIAASQAGVNGVTYANCVAAGLATNPVTDPTMGTGSFSRDFEVNNTADDWGFGYNVGAILSASATRVGLHFRSNVRHTLKGDSEFIGPGINKMLAAGAANPVSGLPSVLGLVNQTVSGKVNLPEIITLSLFHPINEKWELLADLAYTHWSRFKKLTFNFEKLATVDTDTGNVTPGTSVTTPQNYMNGLRGSLGVNHHCNKNWTMRLGYMAEKSPVRDAFRTARLPDANRQWGAVGVQYLTDNKKFAFDASYAHVFFKRNIPLNESDPDPSNYATLSGKYQGRGDLFGAQVTWNID